MNGDCGFASIAKGINAAREQAASSGRRRNTEPNSSSSRRIFVRQWQFRPKRIVTAKDVRHAMYNEVRKARKTYLNDIEQCVFTNDDFEKLERDVSRPGIAGHWLGTVLGVLEHVIVSHAMNIDIYLYQFDLQRQCIRQFESATVEGADTVVYLFFTGPPACGHFDTLVKISDPKQRVFVA